MPESDDAAYYQEHKDDLDEWEEVPPMEDDESYHDSAYEVWKWALGIYRWSLDEYSMPTARGAWSVLEWLDEWCAQVEGRQR